MFRVLGFSVSPIDSIAVKIDDGSWQNCTHVKGPLYVHPWDPNLYATGIHQIHVSFHFICASEWLDYFEYNGTLMNLFYCVGHNKRLGWPTESHHTAFFLGWHSNEFPSTTKTCSHVKCQFSGKKKFDSQSLQHTELVSPLSLQLTVSLFLCFFA
jgi:hypothetical protein